MAKLYERFIRVLQKWPVDPKSSTRKLAEYIREQGKIAFDKHGDLRGNAQECEKRLASLERLSENHWSQKYPRSRQSGALGLTADQCTLALTDESLQTLESSTVSRLFNSVKIATIDLVKKKEA